MSRPYPTSPVPLSSIFPPVPLPVPVPRSNFGLLSKPPVPVPVPVTNPSAGADVTVVNFQNLRWQWRCLLEIQPVTVALSSFFENHRCRFHFYHFKIAGAGATFVTSQNRRCRCRCLLLIEPPVPVPLSWFFIIAGAAASAYHDPNAGAVFNLITFQNLLCWRWCRCHFSLFLPIWIFYIFVS